MEVTQQELADIFEVHPRTVGRWQDNGMPSLGTGPLADVSDRPLYHVQR